MSNTQIIIIITWTCIAPFKNPRALYNGGTQNIHNNERPDEKKTEATVSDKKEWGVEIVSWGRSWWTGAVWGVFLKVSRGHFGIQVDSDPMINMQSESGSGKLMLMPGVNAYRKHCNWNTIRSPPTVFWLIGVNAIHPACWKVNSHHFYLLPQSGW